MPAQVSRFRALLSLVLCLPILAPVASGQAAGSGPVPSTGESPPGDRNTIRPSRDASRHAIRATEEGHEAHNPGQRWLTRFDGRAFLTEPDTGGWTWGLELESYGFAGDRHAVTEPTDVRVSGERLAYRWDSILEEWYVNDARGLEHGYTIHQPPLGAEAGEEAPLILTLAVRGTLSPVVAGEGRDVGFLDGSGNLVLTYSGLRVFDADGRDLRVRFESAGGRLLLSIDPGGARYPLTIDPIAQLAYLKASNTDLLDEFGRAVATSGDTVVVGTYREKSASTGVNGDQSDNSAYWAGAAYVFVRNGFAWNQQAYIKASNTDAEDRFGNSVAISGNTMVIGAPREDSNATGVNGNQTNNASPDAGAAYIFVRNGTTWSQQAYLKSPGDSSADWFGYDVAISGDTVVISAPREASSATGVNGDYTDNSMFGAGAVYVFVRNGTTWSQQAYLKASNTGYGDDFGLSVDVSGDMVVVGAPDEDSSATGIGGDQSDNSAQSAGAAYVFVRSGTSWSQHIYLKASNTDEGDIFGYAVGVSGDTIVIGAPYEDSSALGIDGDQSNNLILGAGAVYVFEEYSVAWVQSAYVKATNTGIYDNFGRSVTIAGDQMVIGAMGEDSNARGVNGNQANNSLPYSGAAYLLDRAGASWSHTAYLKASNPDSEDYFGEFVALSGSTLVVGAPWEESGATGVNGDQSDNGTDRAGAAYVFHLDAPEPGTAYCFGDPGSGTPCPCNNDNDGSVPGSGCDNGYFASGARLAGSGWASLGGDTLILHGSHLEPHEFGLYFQAENDLSPGIAWGDGLRCAGGGLKRIQVRQADAAGSSATTIGVSDKVGNILPGDVKYYQCWYRSTEDPPCGPFVNLFNSSNGYAIQWYP